MIALAWHTAAFSRIEKLKPLDEYLPEVRGPVRVMEDAEIWANLNVWAKRSMN